MERLLIVSSVLLWLLVLFNLLLTLALVRRIGGQAAALKLGQRAPAFEATDLRGQKVSLATYAGRSLALLFVAPHCGPCREELPRLQAVGPQARRAGVELVLVSVASHDETQTFARDNGIDLPILVAPQESNPFMKDYKARGTPYYCVVGPQGRVQAVGFLDAEWRALADSWSAASEARSAQAVATGRDAAAS
jgi:peroxiredoxin